MAWGGSSHEIIKVLICALYVLCAVGRGFSCRGAVDPEDLLDWTTGGKLERLAKHIGTIDYEAVWNDPYVHERLLDLMGADKLAHLKENLQVRGTTDLEGSDLVLEGGKPHKANLENGIMVVDLYNGKVHAGIFSNGHTTAYTKETGYWRFPRSLKIFVHWEKLSLIWSHLPEQDFKWVR